MGEGFWTENLGVIALVALCVAAAPAIAIGSTGRIAGLSAPFDSEVAAVVAATNHYNPVSVAEDREYMGGILRDGNRFYFTVTAGESGQDQITAKIPVPRGFEVTAFWHTHGAAGHSRRYFSQIDTGLAHHHSKPFYLADFTGELKVFRPGDRTMSAYRAQRIGLPRIGGYAKGKVLRTDDGTKLKVRTG